jgi:phosphoglycolate phosphatase-like HAD superfamily hydrolase
MEVQCAPTHTSSLGLLPRPCILFDWSGTISDDAKLCHESASLIARHYGYGIENDVIKWANESSSSATAGTASAAQKCVINSSEIERLHQEFVEKLKSGGLKPSPVGDIVMRLRSIVPYFGPRRLGVVSAHPQVSLESEAAEYGLLPHVFERYMLHGGVTNKRDFIRGFYASSEFGGDPKNIVYVGDSASDVLAAKAAGATAVAVCCGYHTRAKLLEAKPDLIYPSTSDFIDDFITRKMACL